jgi:hypothetical protein
MLRSDSVHSFTFSSVIFSMIFKFKDYGDNLSQTDNASSAVTMR